MSADWLGDAENEQFCVWGEQKHLSKTWTEASKSGGDGDG